MLSRAGLPDYLDLILDRRREGAREEIALRISACTVRLWPTCALCQERDSGLDQNAQSSVGGAANARAIADLRSLL